jgi:hypothetical protein
MLIPVSCHTNLDEYKIDKWPTFMYNPKVGDSVVAESGRKLRIVQITHKELPEGSLSYSYFHKGVYVQVELHQ